MRFLSRMCACELGDVAIARQFPHARAAYPNLRISFGPEARSPLGLRRAQRSAEIPVQLLRVAAEDDEVVLGSDMSAWYCRIVMSCM